MLDIEGLMAKGHTGNSKGGDAAGLAPCGDDDPAHPRCLGFNGSTGYHQCRVAPNSSCFSILQSVKRHPWIRSCQDFPAGLQK